MCVWDLIWCGCGHGEFPPFQPCQQKLDHQECRIYVQSDAATLLHPTIQQCGYCRDIKPKVNNSRVSKLNDPASGVLGRQDSISPIIVASNMPNEITQKQGNMKRETLDAMWTPMSLFFEPEEAQYDMGAIQSFGRNMRCDPPMTGYNQNAQRYTDPITVPHVASDNQLHTNGQGTTYLMRQPRPITLESQWKPSPESVGELPTNWYQQYLTQQPVRTPLTASSTPAFPFADGECGVDSLDYAECMQGGSGLFDHLKASGEN